MDWAGYQSQLKKQQHANMRVRIAAARKQRLGRSLPQSMQTLVSGQAAQDIPVPQDYGEGASYETDAEGIVPMQGAMGDRGYPTMPARPLAKQQAPKDAVTSAMEAAEVPDDPVTAAMRQAEIPDTNASPAEKQPDTESSTPPAEGSPETEVWEPPPMPSEPIAGDEPQEPTKAPLANEVSAGSQSTRTEDIAAIETPETQSVAGDEPQGPAKEEEADIPVSGVDASSPRPEPAVNASSQSSSVTFPVWRQPAVSGKRDVALSQAEPAKRPSGEAPVTPPQSTDATVAPEEASATAMAPEEIPEASIAQSQQEEPEQTSSRSPRGNRLPDGQAIKATPEDDVAGFESSPSRSAATTEEGQGGQSAMQLEILNYKLDDMAETVRRIESTLQQVQNDMREVGGYR